MTHNAGWGCPDPSNPRAKYHYFVGPGKSLCEKWLNPGTLELFDDLHNDPVNCAECRRRRSKLAKDSSEERPRP